MIEQLSELLLRDEEKAAYLFVDPILREPFPLDWPHVACAASWDIPIKHPAFERSQQPRLIVLDRPNLALLEASVFAAVQEQRIPSDEAEAGFTIGGWLLIDKQVDPVALAHHLSRCIQLPVAGDGGRRVLRWNDRRVMEWMWPALSREQRAALLGPVSSWIALDRRNNLVIYQADPDVAAPSLRLTTQQWDRAKMSEIVQELLRGWLSFADELPSDYLQRTGDAVSAIAASGVTSRQDRALLAAYIFQVHPRVLEHPRIESAIARALAGEQSLSQLLQDIPDPDGWNQIREALSHLVRRDGVDIDKEIRHG
ncbi:DUF4123 domain-containing protein [Xanthomonas maliensis]|uniref:DUF4123 domain-containing protein n=2 Tax=Xanthomonas maliensis TaxID=1321368 RepID=UPI001FD15BC7|nr:DUF4123 domain-containing protein [Xanthomonas maliensis]